MGIDKDKKGILKGALESAKNRKASWKANKASRKNIYKLAVDEAKKKYAQDNPGLEMTASKLQQEAESIIDSKETSQYKSDRKDAEKRILKKYNIKNKWYNPFD